MTEQTQLATYNAEVLRSRPGLETRFLKMLELVPEPPDDAVARIVEQILSAETPEELNKPWDSDGMRDLDGQVLTIHDMHKLPSDYRGGLGVYLSCRCTLHSTGETKQLSTGSVNAVSQLVSLYVMKGLPRTVMVRRAERQSRNGYWPYHLEVLAPGQYLAGPPPDVIEGQVTDKTEGNGQA